MSWFQKNRAKIIAECYRTWDIQGKSVLDVGCGNGVVSRVLEELLSVELIGTDIIDYRKENIKFKLMKSSNELPFEDLSFDYVMFNDVLHHCVSYEDLIREGGRIAKNILIFEDCQNLPLDIIDIALNYIYCHRMPCPRIFHQEQEWESIFRNLGFVVEKKDIIKYPLWYPFKHMVFRIKKV
jgi:ubiquinone/menaquinone biosynthesis C-methylase UbiE